MSDLPDVYVVPADAPVAVFVSRLDAEAYVRAEEGENFAGDYSDIGRLPLYRAGQTPTRRKGGAR